MGKLKPRKRPKQKCRKINGQFTKLYGIDEEDLQKLDEDILRAESMLGCVRDSESSSDVEWISLSTELDWRSRWDYFRSKSSAVGYENPSPSTMRIALDDDVTRSDQELGECSATTNIGKRRCIPTEKHSSNDFSSHGDDSTNQTSSAKSLDHFHSEQSDVHKQNVLSIGQYNSNQDRKLKSANHEQSVETCSESQCFVRVEKFQLRASQCHSDCRTTQCQSTTTSQFQTVKCQPAKPSDLSQLTKSTNPPQTVKLTNSPPSSEANKKPQLEILANRPRTVKSLKQNDSVNSTGCDISTGQQQTIDPMNRTGKSASVAQCFKSTEDRELPTLPTSKLPQVKLVEEHHTNKLKSQSESIITTSELHSVKSLSTTHSDRPTAVYRPAELENHEQSLKSTKQHQVTKSTVKNHHDKPKTESDPINTTIKSESVKLTGQTQSEKTRREHLPVKPINNQQPIKLAKQPQFTKSAVMNQHDKPMKASNPINTPNKPQVIASISQTHPEKSRTEHLPGKLVSQQQPVISAKQPQVSKSMVKSQPDKPMKASDLINMPKKTQFVKLTGEIHPEKERRDHLPGKPVNHSQSVKSAKQSQPTKSTVKNHPDQPKTVSDPIITPNKPRNVESSCEIQSNKARTLYVLGKSINQQHSLKSAKQPQVTKSSVSQVVQSEPVILSNKSQYVDPTSEAQSDEPTQLRSDKLTNKPQPLETANHSQLMKLTVQDQFVKPMNESGPSKSQSVKLPGQSQSPKSSTQHRLASLSKHQHYPLKSANKCQPIKTTIQQHTNKPLIESKSVQLANKPQSIKSTGEPQSIKSSTQHRPVTSANQLQRLKLTNRSQPVQSTVKYHSVKSLTQSEPIKLLNEPQSLKSTSKLRSDESPSQLRSFTSTTHPQSVKSTGKLNPIKPLEQAQSVKYVSQLQPVKSVKNGQPVKSANNDQLAISVNKDRPINSAEKGHFVKPANKDLLIKSVKKDQPIKLASKAQLVKSANKDLLAKSVNEDQPAKSISHLQRAISCGQCQPSELTEQTQQIPLKDQHESIVSVSLDQTIKISEEPQSVKSKSRFQAKSPILPQFGGANQVHQIKPSIHSKCVKLPLPVRSESQAQYVESINQAQSVKPTNQIQSMKITNHSQQVESSNQLQHTESMSQIHIVKSNEKYVKLIDTYKSINTTNRAESVKRNKHTELLKTIKQSKQLNKPADQNQHIESAGKFQCKGFVSQSRHVISRKQSQTVPPNDDIDVVDLTVQDEVLQSTNQIQLKQFPSQCQPIKIKLIQPVRSTKTVAPTIQTQSRKLDDTSQTPESKILLGKSFEAISHGSDSNIVANLPSGHTEEIEDGELVEALDQSSCNAAVDLISLSSSCLSERSYATYSDPQTIQEHYTENRREVGIVKREPFQCLDAASAVDAELEEGELVVTSDCEGNDEYPQNNETCFRSRKCQSSKRCSPTTSHDGNEAKRPRRNDLDQLRMCPAMISKIDEHCLGIQDSISEESFVCSYDNLYNCYCKGFKNVNNPLMKFEMSFLSSAIASVLDKGSDERWDSVSEFNSKMTELKTAVKIGFQRGIVKILLRERDRYISFLENLLRKSGSANKEGDDIGSSRSVEFRNKKKLYKVICETKSIICERMNEMGPHQLEKVYVCLKDSAEVQDGSSWEFLWSQRYIMLEILALHGLVYPCFTECGDLSDENAPIENDEKLNKAKLNSKSKWHFPTTCEYFFEFKPLIFDLQERIILCQLAKEQFPHLFYHFEAIHKFLLNCQHKCQLCFVCAEAGGSSEINNAENLDGSAIMCDYDTLYEEYCKRFKGKDNALINFEKSFLRCAIESVLGEEHEKVLITGSEMEVKMFKLRQKVWVAFKRGIIEILLQERARFLRFFESYISQKTGGLENCGSKDDAGNIFPCTNSSKCRRIFSLWRKMAFRRIGMRLKTAKKLYDCLNESPVVVVSRFWQFIWNQNFQLLKILVLGGLFCLDYSKCCCKSETKSSTGSSRRNDKTQSEEKSSIVEPFLLTTHQREILKAFAQKRYPSSCYQYEYVQLLHCWSDSTKCDELSDGSSNCLKHGEKSIETSAIAAMSSLKNNNINDTASIRVNLTSSHLKKCVNPLIIDISDADETLWSEIKSCNKQKLKGFYDKESSSLSEVKGSVGLLLEQISDEESKPSESNVCDESLLEQVSEESNSSVEKGCGVSTGMNSITVSCSTNENSFSGDPQSNQCRYVSNCCSVSTSFNNVAHAQTVNMSSYISPSFAYNHTPFGQNYWYPSATTMSMPNQVTHHYYATWNNWNCPMMPGMPSNVFHHNLAYPLPRYHHPMPPLFCPSPLHNVNGGASVRPAFNRVHNPAVPAIDHHPSQDQ